MNLSENDVIETLDAFIASVLEKIEPLELNAKVRVTCPLCGNTVYAMKTRKRHFDVYCPYCHMKLAA